MTKTSLFFRSLPLDLPTVMKDFQAVDQHRTDGTGLRTSTSAVSGFGRAPGKSRTDSGPASGANHPGLPSTSLSSLFTPLSSPSLAPNPKKRDTGAMKEDKGDNPPKNAADNRPQPGLSFFPLEIPKSPTSDPHLDEEVSTFLFEFFSGVDKSFSAEEDSHNLPSATPMPNPGDEISLLSGSHENLDLQQFRMKGKGLNSLFLPAQSPLRGDPIGNSAAFFSQPSLNLFQRKEGQHFQSILSPALPALGLDIKNAFLPWSQLNSSLLGPTAAYGQGVRTQQGDGSPAPRWNMEGMFPAAFQYQYTQGSFPIRNCPTNSAYLPHQVTAQAWHNLQQIPAEYTRNDVSMPPAGSVSISSRQPFVPEVQAFGSSHHQPSSDLSSREESQSNLYALLQAPSPQQWPITSPTDSVGQPGYKTK